jgi:hypothetical protein
MVKQGAGEDEYTVYIHARPGFVYTKNNTKCSAFINRQLKKPVLVFKDAGLLHHLKVDICT